MNLGDIIRKTSFIGVLLLASSGCVHYMSNQKHARKANEKYTDLGDDELKNKYMRNGNIDPMYSKKADNVRYQFKTYINQKDINGNTMPYEQDKVKNNND